MDFYDLLQDREITQLREQLDRLQSERDLTDWNPRKIRELAEENLELKLRLRVLVRLLIARGVVSAEEYAGLIAAARSGK